MDSVLNRLIWSLRSAARFDPEVQAAPYCILWPDSDRRGLVWAELGESPLAEALEDLVALAEVTKTGLAAGTAEDLGAGYAAHGWRADAALIRALSVVKTVADLEAVTKAIRT